MNVSPSANLSQVQVQARVFSSWAFQKLSRESSIAPALPRLVLSVCSGASGFFTTLGYLIFPPRNQEMTVAIRRDRFPWNGCDPLVNPDAVRPFDNFATSTLMSSFHLLVLDLASTMEDFDSSLSGKATLEFNVQCQALPKISNPQPNFRFAFHTLLRWALSIALGNILGTIEPQN